MRALPVLIAAAILVLGSAVLSARDSATPPLSVAAVEAITRLENEIDRIESEAVDRLAAPPDNQVQQIELLGKLLLYDKDLSVNRNEACAFCHMPEAGFAGPVSEINRTTGSYPGSVRTRIQRAYPADAQLCAAVSGTSLR